LSWAITSKARRGDNSIANTKAKCYDSSIFMEQLKNISIEFSNIKEAVIRGSRVGIVCSFREDPFDKDFRLIQVVSPDTINDYKLSELMVSADDAERANIADGYIVVFGGLSGTQLATPNDLARLNLDLPDIVNAYWAYSEDLEHYNQDTM